ncbi:hypothetical protein [Heterosigma akashiwo virus 01]|jgi:hypothetical protein|uniref:Uncharacterized protein n=1 Tax=Heterosigma akashiwo virus 01 TaxID=97195 RepID=A0A1C9C5E8_HAV01|nr:hypothetical protein D1R72_gp176 [Heterosigma akashiwo virus 01]AOM63507.1 hypothetical protein [Heterosigma akashiwo virus 01]
MAANNLVSLQSPPVFNDSTVPVIGGLTISGSTSQVVFKVEGESEFYNQINACGNIACDGALSVGTVVFNVSNASSTPLSVYWINVSIAGTASPLTASVLAVAPPSS